MCECVNGVREERGKTYHSVFVHVLNDNRGWRLQDFLGVAVDTDAIEEDGLIPRGAERLRNDSSLVTPVVE